MPTFLAGIVIAVVLAAGGYWLLESNNIGVATATDTAAVHVVGS